MGCEGMFERLDAMDAKYEELLAKQSSEEVLNNYNLLKDISKEKAELEDTIMCYRKYKQTLKDIEETKEMESDPELAEIAKEELASLEENKTKLYHDLELALVPKDENDGKNVIMEIRGAAGGF